jgi:RNA polymerase sigma-70 factor (ECF subfamily)
MERANTRNGSRASAWGNFDDNGAEPAVAGDGASNVPISQLADHLFRHEAGKLVSVLTNIFGLEHLQLAEDVVQDALIRAMQTWPFYGVPKNPAAWLTQTAKNLALDVLRREKRFSEKQGDVVAWMEQSAGSADEVPAGFQTEIQDSTLRLMFACFHPQLPGEAQIALALKTLCGFSPADIGKAFLTTEAAIAKRLTRARQRIAELQIPFAIPAGPELDERLDGVLHTLYLLFNEGYKASSGECLIREDLCREAIRLASVLATHPAGDLPGTHALLALMFFNAARLSSRVDQEGNLVPLSDQDRSRWDRQMIARGMMHLARSAVGGTAGIYHYEAGIAACHATAADETSTDWARILDLYDRLMEIDESPVLALNRAVAVANVQGPEAGIDDVAAIRGKKALDEYHLLHAVLGELESRRGNAKGAVKHLEAALALTSLRSEQAHLRRRIAACRATLASS